MKNIIEFFEESIEKYPSNPFLWEKTNDHYQALTYQETQKKVEELAGAFLSLGLQKGDRVALLSEGRNYWLISELALLYIGCINVPLSTKLEGDTDLSFRLNHSESRFILTSANQLAKIRSVKDQLKNIEKTLIFDDLPNLEENEICLNDLLSNPKNKVSVEILDARKKEVLPSDVANIVYTSGTTADPKGIMLTHRNYTANVEQAFSYISIPEHYITLVVLPWDHAFAHTAALYSFMHKGAGIASVKIGSTPLETLKNFSNNMLEIKPHVLMSVPAIAKNFKKNIETGIQAKGKIIYSLFNAGLSFAYWYNGTGDNKGTGLKFLTKPIYSFFNTLIFKKIKEKFGGQLEYFIGGGALLDIELQRFFYALGMPMYQGYGLSEAAPIISANTPKYHRLGTSGKIVNDLKVKICNEDGQEVPIGEKGEIVIQGENVMAGYWKNDTATAETIKDNWLYTGDLGYLTNDHYLYVLGRFKSLLIGADGEKYSPEGIEEAIIDHCPLIDQFMLHNNQNPYTIGLLVPNKENISKWLKDNKKDLNKEPDNEELLQAIQTELNQFKAGGELESLFPQRWLPAAVVITTEAFTEHNKLLNSTMKVVRGKVEDHFKQDIEFLYTPTGKIFLNERNKENLKTFMRQ
jgi:long-chain acyl-CoA synthetase